MEYQGDLRERCFRFSVALVKLVRRERNGIIERAILDQLIRSGTSIGANVAEAAAASSRKDFVRFNEYALRSANETVYWLCLIRDAYGSSDECIKLLNECTQLSRILGSIVVKLKSSL